MPTDEASPDPLGTRSLSTALRREIEKLILSGKLSAGHRLSENSFAERFKVSRGPVREAFRSLVEAGLLEFIPHRGVFIRQISLTEAIDSYEVRAGLFGLAGRLAATRIAEAETRALRKLVGAMTAELERDDSDAYYKLNLELHARILAATRNARLIATYEGLIKELHLFRSINLESHAHLVVSNAEHDAMAKALEERDPVRAFDTHFAHVMNAKDRVLEIRDDLGADAERPVRVRPARFEASVAARVSDHMPAAVHREGLSGDVAGVRSGEIAHRRGDLLGLARTCDRSRPRGEMRRDVVALGVDQAR